MIDANDKCANTPAGTEVDATGCEVEEEEVTPVVIDTDGDGVADADDKCANTPANTLVDATGCPVTTGGNGNGGTTTPVTPRANTTR